MGRRSFDLRPRAANGPHYRIPLPAGCYTSQLVIAGALTTIAAAVNRLEYYPYIPANDQPIDEIAVVVTTGVASALSYIAIYDSDGPPLAGMVVNSPKTRLVTSGALDCSTTGAKTATVAATLRAGHLYWLAVHSNSTQTFRGLNSPLPLGDQDGSTASYQCGLRGTPAFAALPAIATAPSNATTITTPVFFRMRIA